MQNRLSREKISISSFKQWSSSMFWRFFFASMLVRSFTRTLIESWRVKSVIPQSLVVKFDFELSTCKLYFWVKIKNHSLLLTILSANSSLALKERRHGERILKNWQVFFKFVVCNFSSSSSVKTLLGYFRVFISPLKFFSVRRLSIILRFPSIWQ